MCSVRRGRSTSTKSVAETTWANIKKVGMPQWSEADQTLAKALQKELGSREQGLSVKIGDQAWRPVIDNRGGGSDDIGDISWNVPTVTLRYPSNIPGLPGHNWANAIAMATPIAHKGATAGAKVQAMTMIDLLTKPTLVQQAWDYFRDVQTKSMKYEPLIRPQDKPAIDLNRATMEKYRGEMRKYYFDPSRYKTYLEQLGIRLSDGKKVRKYRMHDRKKVFLSPSSLIRSCASAFDPSIPFCMLDQGRMGLRHKPDRREACAIFFRQTFADGAT